MPIRSKNLYKPKIPQNDPTGMIRIKGTGDFFVDHQKVAKGCCGTPSGWKEYSVRLKIPAGILTPDVMSAIADIARKYGNGDIYLTTRLGIEIPGITEDIYPAMEKELAESGIEVSGCGPHMRAVVTCKGSICVHGNIDTFRLSWEIDQRFNDNKQLPNKFKIAVSGCPSSCSRPELNDVGLIGVYEPNINLDLCEKCGLCKQACHMKAIELNDGLPLLLKDKCINCGDCGRVCISSAISPLNSGVDIYAGGRWGRKKQMGIRIARFLTEDDATSIRLQ